MHGFFKWLERRRYKTHVRILLAKYRRFVPCPACGGAKLKPEALNVRVDGRSIAEVGRLSMRDLVAWIDEIGAIAEVATRAAVVMRELRNRVGYLVEVGLGYLTLERQARTLSGGEAQRIHLASALGSVLAGTLYALDEPTVGLHAADARRLLEVLHSLRDFGNTVVVVEHDPAMIAGADYVVELGPGGGSEGGELTYSGPPAKASSTHGVVAGTRAADARDGEAAQIQQARSRDSNRRRARAQSRRPRRGDSGRPHGLRDRSFRLRKIDAGRDVLYNNWLRRRATRRRSPANAIVSTARQIGEIVHMGQELPTRSMRSNPATYLKIYDDIRKLFAASPEARRLGVKARHFSFNVTGGRCEQCHGTGTVTIEMHFMADLEVSAKPATGAASRAIFSRSSCQLQNQPGARSHCEEARAFFVHHPRSSSGSTRWPRSASATSARADHLDAVGRRGAAPQARAISAGRSRTHAGRRGRQASAADVLLDEPTTGLSSTDISAVKVSPGWSPRATRWS